MNKKVLIITGLTYFCSFAMEHTNKLAIDTLPNDLKTHIVDFMVCRDTLEQSIKSKSDLISLKRSCKAFYTFFKSAKNRYKSLCVPELAATFNMKPRAVTTSIISLLKINTDNEQAQYLYKAYPANEKLSYDLLQAAQKGDATQVATLLAQDANVNACDASGETALIKAAARGHESVVRLLLSNGARIDAQTLLGHDAMYMALKNCHTNITQILMGL